MQRHEADGVIISCDFCGTDWDPYDERLALPMAEGHHGSVICLACLQLALQDMAPGAENFRCAMCVQENLDASVPHWHHPQPTPGAGLNAEAVACRPCIRQAAGRFHKDKDVDWTWENRS